MSFFGFQEADVEEEKRRFLQGGFKEEEDIAVYNWGQDDYDGLGNALQEGGDELNDETFGSSGPVGKDFDFTAQALPNFDKPSKPVVQAEKAKEVQQVATSAKPASAPRQQTDSRESIWDDKSPFSVLPRSSAGSIGRRAGVVHQSNLSGQVSAPAGPRFSARDSPQPTQHSPHLAYQSSVVQQGTAPITYATAGVRTAEDVEAEMRAQMLTQRARAAQLQQQQQQQKPPRMRSQSPSAYVIQHAHQQRREQSPNIMLQQQQQLEQARMEELERQLREQALASRLQEQRMMELREAQAMQLEQQMQQQMTTGQSREHRRQTSGPTLADLQLIQQQLQAQVLSGAVDPQLQQYFNQQVQQLQREQLQREQLRMQSPQTHYGLHTPNQTLSHAQAQVQSQALVQNLQNIQNVQLQQRLLAQLAQAEFSQTLGVSGGIPVGSNGNGNGLPLGANARAQEALRVEAMRKITETERLEGKRRRKAAKIAHMSRFNDLMTQSDKDFITRIQVSQLVTSDPYTEDFYAQVYGSLLRSRMGLNTEERVLKFGSGEGVGLGVAQRGGGRRPNAMQRMEAQVERIVNNARLREKEKGLHAIHSLQGALGKTAGRSYKAAPRQLLQVELNGHHDPSQLNVHGHISKEDAKENTAGAAKEAAKRGREALGAHAGEQQTGIVHKDPLTRRQTLVVLENLYELLLKVEQLRREQPPAEEGEEKANDWTEKYNDLVQKLWDGLQVMVPLETSNPHPFISLLMPAKGKKLLPRVTRHFSSQQLLTILTLLVACFIQLDVVRDAPLLDSGVDSPERKEVERQTQIFVGSVLQCILSVVAKSNLRLIGGLLGLFMERCELHVVARSKPGLLLLTGFLSRVEVIRADMSSGVIDASERPTEEDMLSWKSIYDHLFNVIAPYALSLFPSPGALVLSLSSPDFPPDALEEPVWQFLAMLALHASNEQQQLLVTTLREKILDNVVSVSKGLIADEAVQQMKIANVNIFLHALGLDSSQINF